MRRPKADASSRCNFLVCIAIWLGLSARDSISKIVGLWIPIFAFVMLRFEHVSLSSSLDLETRAHFLLEGRREHVLRPNGPAQRRRGLSRTLYHSEHDPFLPGQQSALFSPLSSIWSVADLALPAVLPQSSAACSVSLLEHLSSRLLQLTPPSLPSRFRCFCLRPTSLLSSFRREGPSQRGRDAVRVRGRWPSLTIRRP